MIRVRGCTSYQLEIIQAIAKCAAEGYDMDLDQLLTCLSWGPSKQSLQFSIRALIAKEMIVKTGFQTRRGRKRVCFALTPASLAMLDPRPAAAPAATVQPTE